MFSKPTNSINIIASTTTGRSSARIAAAAAAIFFGATSASLAAIWPGYTFLTLSNSTGTGNATNTQFSGTNGVINVTHSFPPGGAGLADNNNFGLGFHPGQFTNMFPGTGQVQGHLAQTVYAHTSTVTFDMTGYTITPDTAFGIWNTTDEVTKPVGGNPVYQVQLVIANSQTNPTSFFYMGNQDNQTQVQGSHTLVMTPSNGEITFGAAINTSNPNTKHTDAAFWKNIPLNTQKIIVYADLPALNTLGDGVGYYFAELVPEPCSGALLAVGMFSIGLLGSRRRR